MKVRFLSSLLFIWCSAAVASYRVFELKIEHYDRSARLERIENVTTNLDPLQYAAFHGGDGRMKVRLQSTWYCPGDTSRRAYCPKPKTPQRIPASWEHEKRIPLNLQPVIP